MDTLQTNDIPILSPFQEGFRAGFSKQPKDNPYPISNPNNSAWDSGYLEAQAEFQINIVPITSATQTTVVNIKTCFTDNVYIGRAGHGQDGYFGNPFKNSTRAINIAMYKMYFLGRLGIDPEFKRRVHELKGKKLGCFCHPLPCHGDVIAEYLNSLNDNVKDI